MMVHLLEKAKVMDMGLPIYEQYCKIKNTILFRANPKRKKRKILGWVHPSQVLR
jgi:hypothetical protein